MAFHHVIMDRDGRAYKSNHYRAHWQPLWAVLGIFLCSLLLLFSGWSAIYDLVVRSKGIARRDSIVDIVAAYLGVSISRGKFKSTVLNFLQPVLFFLIYLSYKWRYGTRFRSMNEMANVWFPANVPDEDEKTLGVVIRKDRGRFREFISWLK